MGFIYKITNLINGKVYIGQTNGKIERRFSKHISNSFNEKANDYDCYLHRAIRKYGKENFKIEPIEECDESVLNDREVYWIGKYNSFSGAKNSNGYNMTFGGDGAKKYSVNYIQKLWQDGMSIQEIVKHLKCTEKILYSKLRDLPDYQERKAKSLSKTFLSINSNRKIPIDVYDINGNYIKTFQSQKEAADELKIDKANLNAVLRGKVLSVKGYRAVYKGEILGDYKPKSGKRAVLQLDKEGNILNEFESCSSAAKTIKGDGSQISKCCRNERLTAYGFRWKYKET